MRRNPIGGAMSLANGAAKTLATACLTWWLGPAPTLLVAASSLDRAAAIGSGRLPPPRAVEYSWGRTRW